MSREKSLPLPSVERGSCNLHPAPSQSWRGLALAHLASHVLQRRDQPSWRFPLDGFMTRWCSTPSAPGSYASIALAKMPTMILCETRGLQLFWVVRGGIGLNRRLGAELS